MTVLIAFEVDNGWTPETYGWLLGTYLKRAGGMPAEDVIRLDAVFTGLLSMQAGVGAKLALALTESVCHMIDEVGDKAGYSFEEYLQQVAAAGK